MASKQGKLKQRNKQVASRRPSQELPGDALPFLEQIDAPEWVDLSLEACLNGKEGGFDSWFERSHKHHVISLAGLNSSMSWLRLGISSQVKGPVLSRSNIQTCQQEVKKPEKKQTMVPLNKSGNEQSNCQNQATSLRVRKGAFSSCNTDSYSRGSNAHRLYGSLETGDTLSGHSRTSECETSGSFKKHSLCSDRSSVSSSQQTCPVQLKLSSSSIQRRKSRINRSDEFYDTPTSTIVDATRNKNSSSVSYCPPMVKSRFSSEVGVLTGTKLRYSSDLGVSTVENLQSGCKGDSQSSGDSVLTSFSGVSQTSGEQVDRGCARLWEEETNELKKVCELEDDVDHKQSQRRGFIANLSLLHGQQRANEDMKSGIRVGRQRLEPKVSQVRSLSRKDLFSGKENAPPKKKWIAANFVQAKNKPFHTRVPLATASSKTENAKPVGLSSGGGFQSARAREKEGPPCVTQVVHSKTGVLQNLNRGRGPSSVAQQRKRSEAKQLPFACETWESQRELAALAVQHNRAIRNLGVQNCRKVCHDCDLLSERKFNAKEAKLPMLFCV